MAGIGGNASKPVRYRLRGRKIMDHDGAIRKALEQFLAGGQAHASMEDAVRDFPSSLYAAKPAGAPHSAWQLLEHIRLAQHDLLEFCRNPEYKAPKWPEEYWPPSDAPGSPEAWNRSVAELNADLKQFIELIRSPKTDLYSNIPWGDGQNILREVLLAGDHTSYHTGQLLALRKQLGAWEK